MKKSIFLLLMLSLILGLLMSSCNDKEQADKGVFISTILFIKYSHPDGTNLLKNDSQIEVYYDKNGFAEIVNQPNLDYPKGYMITTERDAKPDGSDELCVKVFPSDYYNEENISTTYVKLGNYQMDTIQCQFNITPNSVSLCKTWHKGTLVWDLTTKMGSPYPLIKMIK
jgi:hypothetical protein